MADHPLYTLRNDTKAQVRALERHMNAEVASYYTKHKASIDRLAGLICNEYPKVEHCYTQDILKHELKIAVYCYRESILNEPSYFHLAETRQIKLPYAVIEDPSLTRDWILRSVKKGETWALRLTDELDSLLIE